MRKRVPAAFFAVLLMPLPAIARQSVSEFCGPAWSTPVPDDQPITVRIPPAPPFTVGSIRSSWWRAPPVADPTWQLAFRGLTWAKPIARRAHADGQRKSLSAIIGQVVTFHRQNPDPGTTDHGWSESAAMKRLDAENCLYSLTPAAVLRAGMVADAGVLLGRRYFGPPASAVHNHGLMANLQLFRAGTLLGIPAWKSAALTRMVNEAPLAFSAQGVTVEQSAEYQRLNIGLWTRASRHLRQSGYPVPANSIDRTLAQAAVAFRWMTEPDGRIVQIGDSARLPGDPHPAYTARLLRDDATGWIVGRWSWRAANTTYYTVRYGPARRAHGHHDRAGGVTWSPLGIRVLVGPGRFNYDPATKWFAYQRGPRSHNVAVPPGRSVVGNAGHVSGSLIQAPAHAWQITDRMFGVPHTRAITVNRAAQSIRVSDQFAGPAWWHQYWHLDPSWRSVATTGTRLTFSHPSGKRLAVHTTGRVARVVKGGTAPVQGWNFPDFRSRVPAYEIVIRSYGKSSVTSFTVS